MGLTLKKLPDLRNTKVVDIIFELRGYGIDVDIMDHGVHLKKRKRIWIFSHK